jgi:hypothetical protein
MSGIARHHAEWLSLIEVSGPFLTPPVLIRAFPQGLPKVDGKKLGRLRVAYEEWANARDTKASDAGALHMTWVQLVLGELLEFEEQTLRSGDGLPANLTVSLAEHRETLQPSVAIVEPTGRARAGTPRLLVSVWPSDQDLESAAPAARWAATPLERMTQLCRSTGVRLGLVTNGERWTLVDAPVGQTAGYASWYAGLWLQEPITLAAFEALLGVRRFFAVAETDTVEALLDESVAFQQEVTDQLGYQVRRAVEVLVQALDRADLDRNRELLRDVPAARLYDAALTVMMRLVFLFCAEERGLLLLGDETYDANYAVSTLRALLREEADRVGVEVLERRQDAWARLLATFRAVHGGIEHEALRLPALGGSLFDPDRFPFLEGRAAGTSWRDTPASPLPIDNRTVLHLLEALQLLRSRGDGGRAEARKLSYRALDIEQVGHVYEGLLDHVAVRVDADTLGLAGTKDKEPELSIDELDRERDHGKDKLIEFLKQHTGRSISALRTDLDATLEEDTQQRLLVACGNDKALLKRIAPYHALVRADVWGYPQIYRANSLMVTGGSERRQTGAHYTPKSLTEQIVTETLESVVYAGPAEGKPRDAWKLRSAVELLDLKICDMAMGSGAFLVQVCRWLAERVVEAWEQAERQGDAISADGEILQQASGHNLLPTDREERLSFARRLVAERCIYGVDINPMAVELAKLSLWLVTLAKGRPFGFLDHNLRRGDSLLGISRLEQLTELSLDPSATRQRRLFGKSIERAVAEAVKLRQKLKEIPVRDIRDVEAMATLDAEARKKLNTAKLLADAFIGLVFAAESPGGEAGLAGLAADAERLVNGEERAAETLVGRVTKDLAKDSPSGEPRHLLHWPLEFPEVFSDERGGFDALVLNPPFMGGAKITGRNGHQYLRYLKAQFESRQNTDLCAYFVQRVLTLCAPAGNLGFLATKTIAQADTREASLELVARTGSIYFARTSIPWPGVASVIVSILAASRTKSGIRRTLDGHTVESIDSFLSSEALFDGKPHVLVTPVLSFKGVTVVGTDGFCVSVDHERAYILSDPRNRMVVKSFLGGANIMRSVGSVPDRTIIDFADMPIEEARSYAAPFEHLAAHVRPLREKVNRKAHRERWWQYGDVRQGLRRAIDGLDRTLVSGQTVKYLAFVWCPSTWVFDQKCVVVATNDDAHFAILNSTLFDVWSRALCATLGETLSFAPSDAYETFVWPDQLNDLTAFGRNLEKARTMASTSCGRCLTDTYNAFHDESQVDAVLDALRDAHRKVDLELAKAYGWADIDLEHGFHSVPYLPANDRVRFTISEPARLEVLRRLGALNRQRYAELKAPVAKLRSPKGRAHVATAGQGTLALVDVSAPEAKASKTSAAAPAKKASPRRTSK